MVEYRVRLLGRAKFALTGRGLIRQYHRTFSVWNTGELTWAAVIFQEMHWPTPTAGRLAPPEIVDPPPRHPPWDRRVDEIRRLSSESINQ